MTTQYGFFIDSSRCTGCKTCELACKDYKDLTPDVSFRRIYEYAGGDWQEDNGVWHQNVFAYYLSIACNHCEDPACTKVCPSGAMHKREDGFVVVDEDVCIGCRYCHMACPYGAPQYNAAKGHMTKCDGCHTRVADGKKPICVESCPLRALDFGPIEELRQKHGQLAAVAPLLCAGITTYSPLHHWKVGPGQKVGIVGLGGLGHMGVKIAAAMGAEVYVFSTSPNKRDDAKRLGAKDLIVSKDADQMAAHEGSFDFILNTVAAPHDLDALLVQLKRDGTMCLVGVPAEPHPAPSVGNLVFRRRALAGSLIGGIKETQEMLDFCKEHGLTSDIEMIRMEQIDEAYDRMVKGDVKYRFVIDMATLKAAA